MKIHHHHTAQRALLFLLFALGLCTIARAEDRDAMPSSQQAIERSSNQTTCYVQFSGVGRTLLTTSATGKPQPIVVSNDQPTDNHLKWTVTLNGNTAKLKNGVGQWLAYMSDGTLATTLNESEATQFGWSTNSYYAAEGFERYQLLLPGSTTKAIGVRSGVLTTVAANSRYAVVLLAQEVKGTTLPTMETPTRTPYYYLGYQWANETAYNYVRADKTKTPTFYADKAANFKGADNEIWAVEEANELGDVKLRSRSGAYARQVDNNVYTITESADEAAVLRLVENATVADEDAIFKFSWSGYLPLTIQWSNFWQIKNVANGKYLFIGDRNCMGGEDNKFNIGSSQVNVKTNGAYCMPNNRMNFIPSGVVDGIDSRYVQFSGVGRVGLYSPDGKQVAASTETQSITDDFLWNVIVKGETVQLQNEQGGWVHYDATDGSLQLVADDTEATTFGWTTNTYYADAGLDRHQIVLPGQSDLALGVKDGKLCPVPVNSRYSVVYVGVLLQGSPMPEYSTLSHKHYYNIGMHWGNNAKGKDWLYSKGNGNNVDAGLSNGKAQSAYRWTVEEANSLGDVVLRNKEGLYLAQKDVTSAYIATDNKSEAAVLRLTEAVDQGVVTWYNDKGVKEDVSGQYWPEFWQLKNTANDTYFFEGNDQAMGGTSNHTSWYKYSNGLGKYKFAFNRLYFDDTNEVIETCYYLHFSGMGRTVLHEQDGKVEVVMPDTALTSKATAGWQWNVVEEGGKQYLQNADALYLRIDASTRPATFSAVTSSADATAFTVTTNTYYKSVGLDRYNLALATDNTKALGVDNSGRLNLVPSNSRYSVVRFGNQVDAPEAVELSTDEKRTMYNIDWLYENSSTKFSKNYIYTNASNQLRVLENAYTRLNASYIWMLHATSDGSGDFIMQSASGYYIKQTDGASIPELTDKESEAARYRLVESADREHKYAGYWQIQHVASGKFVFVGWSFQLGGTNNGIKTTYDGVTKGNYNYSNNRIELSKTTDGNLRGYVLFSAMGPRPLRDNGGFPFASFGLDEPLDKGAFWTLIYKDNHHFLRSDEGNYLAYSDAEGFVTTPNEAEAYPFNLQFSDYQNNASLRFELLSTDGRKALSVDNSGDRTGELSWGARDTRYSVIHISDFVAGPTLPDENAKHQDMKVYRIYTASRSMTHYMLTDNQAGNPVTTTPRPDDDYTATDASGYVQEDMKSMWLAQRTMTDGAYIGDINVRSLRGNWLCYDETNGRFYMASKGDNAAIMRLVESDENTDAWQLQYVGHNESGQFVPYEGGMANVMRVKEAANGGTNTLVLGYPNAEAAFLSVELTDIYPRFFDDEGGAYRAMQFIDVEGTPYINYTDETVEATGTSMTSASSTWKLVGDNNNFVIKTYTGKYLRYDSEQGKFMIVDDESTASHFGLLQNTVKTGDNLVWCVCLLDEYYEMPEQPSCIKRNADGSLSMVNYMDNYKVSETGVFFTRHITPYFSSEQNTFYNYITFPSVNTDDYTYYLTSNENGSLKVIGQTKIVNTVDNTNRKVEFINGQLWAFVGTTDDFVIMSRDSTYLAWNTESETGLYIPDCIDDCFVPVTEREYASHFAMVYDADVDNEYVITFKPRQDAPAEVKALSGQSINLLKGNAYRSVQSRWNDFHLGLQSTVAPTVTTERWTVSDAEDYSGYTIKHKRSWFVREAQSFTGEAMTGFVTKDNTSGYTTNPYTGDQIQETNTFTVDMYIKDGTYRYLYMPSMMRVAPENGGAASVGATSVRAYQRFYNYETEERIDPHLLILKRKSRRNYDNGTVMGMYLNLNNAYGAFVGEEATFQMPVRTPEHYRYTVGIDASCYSDFVDYFGDNALAYEDSLRTREDFVVPRDQDLIEPTLSGRYLYVIHNAREMADSLMACPSDGNRWLEQHTIAFPKKKVGQKNCTIPLNLQLQNYWIYDTNSRPVADIDERNNALVNLSNYKYLLFEIEDKTNPAGIALYYPDGTDAPDAQPIDGAGTLTSDLSERRFIRFLYPRSNDDGTPIAGNKQMALPTEVGCALGDSAIIKVYAVAYGTALNGDLSTAKRYNLARYTLYFEDGTEPLPYTEVLGYKTNKSMVKGQPNLASSKHTRNDYLSLRSPQALEAAYGAPRATINFNADEFKPFVTPPFGRSTVAKHTSNSSSSTSYPLAPSTTIDNSYGIPLLYNHTSYDFQPFQFSQRLENTWGSYTICRELQVKWTSSSKNHYRPMQSIYKDTYSDQKFDDTNAAFMYVDASELPGSVCSLQYDGTLCRGSRLYFSAWVSSPDSHYNNVETKSGIGAPCNILLTVKGIQVDPETGEQTNAVDLYTYCPGPIYETARAADGSIISRGEGEEGIWQQVFFSFVNNRPEEFQRYELTIDNACTNSNGGDIMIDEVQMFAQKPTVSMERTTPVCGQRITLAKLTCDYQGMLNSLGLEEDEEPAGGMPRMWYCLLDKEMYDQTLAAAGEHPSTSDVQSAFNAALVGNPYSTKNEEKAFRSVVFSTHFDQIPAFTFKEALSDTLSEAIVRSEVDAKGERHMVISDKVSGSNIKGYHKYYLVFVPRYGDSPITPSYAAQEFQMGDSCCIVSEFETTSSVAFLDDGADSTMVGNTITVCANQSLNITAKLNGINNNTGAIVLIQPMYDWWLDYALCDFSHVFFTQSGAVVQHDDGKPASSSEASLHEALVNFRHHYPKATSFEGITPVADEAYPFTQAMLTGLRTLTQNVPPTVDASGTVTDPGHIAPLHLYSTSINVSLPRPETEADRQKIITIVPIQTEASDSIVYCYDPQQLNIDIVGIAPKMLVGFRPLEQHYPTYITNGVVRTSETFVQSIHAADFHVQPTQLWRLPVRSISLVSKQNAIGLKLVERDGMEYAPVYLVGTNDAQTNVYETVEGVADFRQVGRVVTLNAPKEVKEGEDSYADLYLFDNFQPREGYYYSLRIGFVEAFKPGHILTDEEKNVCEGSMAFDLYIVPKYEVWTGGANTTDWTDDRNWARASSADLHQPAGYVDNATQGTSQGYVPLSYTNVVIKGDAPTQPYLYAVTNNDGADKFIAFTGSDEPAQRTAAEDIEYEMVVDGTSSVSGTQTYYRTRPFHTYMCSNLVIQAGAELAHAERLLRYSKAWVEYELAPSRWYTLASPLRRMLAGDWYAPTKGGRQQTPYFRPVMWSATAYDRFSPAVYQRGWDKGTTTLYYLQGTGTAAQTHSVNVAVRANWSSVYNDVRVQYAGGGFSVKANAAGKNGNTYNKVLFRLPKEDATYDYYTYDGTLHNNTQAAERSDEKVSGDTLNLSARLQTDLLRGNSEAAFTQTYTNHVADNLYFLVGNPFACGLDMRKFFAANTDAFGTEGWQYWLLTEKGQTSVMRGRGAEGWIAVNADAADKEGIVAAGQGFFVVVPKGSSALTTTTDGVQLTLQFTADMQVSAAAAGVKLRAPQRERTELPTLRIKASREGRQSEAVVIKQATASNHFAAAEDLPTLLDATLSDVPTIYTLADSAAVTVNHCRSLYRLPLGMSSESAEEAEVTFSGMQSFDETLSLLDEYTGHVYPLTLASGAADTDTVTIRLEGLTAGRYYLMSSEVPSAADDDVVVNKPFAIVSGNQVSLHGSTTSPLTFVSIVDAAGRQLYHFTPYVSNMTLKLPMGVYVITLRTDKAQSVVKVSVE